MHWRPCVRPRPGLSSFKFESASCFGMAREIDTRSCMQQSADNYIMLICEISLWCPTRTQQRVRTCYSCGFRRPPLTTARGCAHE
eukprot:5515065-Pyramimonas_sp.AAC.1